MMFVHTQSESWENSTYYLCKDCGEREWSKEYAHEYSKLKTRKEMHAMKLEFCESMKVQAERRIKAAAGTVEVYNLSHSAFGF